MWRRSLLHSFALAVLTACSAQSSGDGTPTGGPGSGGPFGGTPGETPCAEYARRECLFEQTCEPVATRWWNGDWSACAARRTSECLDMLRAKGTGTTTTSLQTCARALSTYSCDDVFVSGKWLADCLPRGTLVDGAPCGIDAQCRRGSCELDLATGGTCGTCQPRSPEGGPCSSSTNCDRNFTCSHQTCVPRIPLDGPCDGTVKCIGVLVCMGAASGNGKCSKPLPQGARCDVDALPPLPCDPGYPLECDEASKTCVELKNAGFGQPCGMLDPDAGSSSPYISCDWGLYCQASASGSERGICQHLLLDGAPCGDLDPCMSPSLCLNSVCTLPNPNDCH